MWKDVHPTALIQSKGEGADGERADAAFWSTVPHALIDAARPLQYFPPERTSGSAAFQTSVMLNKLYALATTADFVLVRHNKTVERHVAWERVRVMRTIFETHPPPLRHFARQ